MNVGDVVLNTVRERSGTLVSEVSKTHVMVDYGSGPSITSRTFLKVVKQPRRTDVQAAVHGDPELLDLIKSHYFSNGGEAFVSCQAAVRDAEAEKLSGISGLSLLDALDYISEATDKSHGAKYYLVVSNGTAGPEFFERVARYFRIEGHTSKNSHQFNSHALVEWLIREHGVLPRKRY